LLSAVLVWRVLSWDGALGGRVKRIEAVRPWFPAVSPDGVRFRAGLGRASGTRGQGLDLVLGGLWVVSMGAAPGV